MDQQTYDHTGPILISRTSPAGNRRREFRLDGQLRLTFSGMDATEIVMDTGTAFDLGRDGIGLQTERSLKLGMELALIIEVPGSEEDICISEAQVAWVKGDRIGLSIRTMKPGDRYRLQRAFSSTRLQPEQ